MLVVGLTRKEFMELNNWDNKVVGVVRDKYNFEKLHDFSFPVKTLVIVKNGKNNLVLFERVVGVKDFETLDTSKGISEQMEYEQVELYKANGSIIATAEITGFCADTSTLYLNKLFILNNTHSLKKAGLKRVPYALCETNKEFDYEN